MPRRTVFRTLSYLCMHDVIQLLCADRRLRPFVHATSFAPWRKRYLKLRHAESMYERALRHTPTDDDACGASDEALVHAYDEALAAMHLHSAPVHLSELLCAAQLCTCESLPSPQKVQRFLVPWMLGRVGAEEAFALFDHAQAVELLYFLRVFLALVRLSRLSQPSSSSSTQYHQMFHVLDADCAEALDDFFAPPAEAPRTQQFTTEQARFVEFQVRRSDLTGKTRSLLAYAQRRPHQRFLYITFNAAAARDARQRFPPNVDCRTMHSVALQHVTLPDGQAVGPLRPRDVARWLPQLPVGKSTKATAQGRSNTLAPTTVALYVLRTLDRFMQSMDPHVRAEVHTPWSMTQSTDLAPQAVAEAAQALWDMIGTSQAPNGRRVPCPHDAYVKYLQLHPEACVRLFREYNALLLDEAQDLSACQTSILLSARGHCGVIVVGDVHQKIYGFRGGSALAFHARLYPPTATFHLTQSFRFGPEVAAIATKVLRLKAPPPWHNEREHGAWLRPRLTGHGADAVRVHGAPMARPHTRIYRTNALLAREMLWLASTLPPDASLYLKTSQTLTHRAMVDLLRDAHKLYHGQADAIPHGSPLRDFAAWKELEEHVEAEEGGDGKLGVVLSLVEAIAAPDFLERLCGLERQFVNDEKDASVILTTVHQAKGLEWDRVLVADDFSPALQARVLSLRPQVAQFGAQDELNHMYVALTRARRELVIPPCVLQWLVASEGLFRYRLTGKSRSTACGQCHARKVCLVQLCRRYAGTSRFDDRVDTLGCLRCVRQQLADDEDLEDFVRWIDMCGVSAATGQLSTTAMARTLRRYQSAAAPSPKRARTEPAHHGAAPRHERARFACLARAERAERYVHFLEEQQSRVEMWMALGSSSPCTM